MTVAMLRLLRDWRLRSKQQDTRELKNKSEDPHRSPHKTSTDAEEQIVQKRKIARSFFEFFSQIFFVAKIDNWISSSNVADSSMRMPNKAKSQSLKSLHYIPALIDRNFKMQLKIKSLFTLFPALFFLIGFSFTPLKLHPSCNGCYEKYWQGVYASVQIGEGWNLSDLEYVNPNYFNTLGPSVLGSNFSFRTNRLIAGGALGFNYQIEQLVLSLEGGALSSHFKKSLASPFFQIWIGIHIRSM